MAEVCHLDCLFVFFLSFLPLLLMSYSYLNRIEEHLLTFYAFPQVMHKFIRSNNAIESFFSNVRRRTNQIDTFTTETSCLSIVWATMQGIHLPRIPIV